MATIAGTVLERGEVLPGVPMLRPSGEEVRVWDYRGRRAVLLAFLHDDCEPCEGFSRGLAVRGEDLALAETEAFAVFPRSARDGLRPLLDPGGRAAETFLGEEPLRPTIVVADRYAAAWDAWPVLAHEFPEPQEVTDALWRLATQCDHCEVGWR